ncbi:hypothetical protein CPB86DRAFT_780285 [Serendipita vermifera]|nr:hypothetical protein CPB86DRAFT_780285 [Serendipita vermifera]
MLHHPAPVEALPSADPSNEVSSSPLSCHDINKCRTISHIVWSCLATILAYTWLSMHLNIPYPADKRRMNIAQRCSYSTRTFLRNKMVPFLVALIIPEWFLALAIQQCMVANRIAQQGGKGWTRVHGFFVLMGGFHAFRRQDEKSIPIDDHGEPCYPLDSHTVIELVNEGKIQLPSEEEIQDRSKSDWVFKALVLLQTTWFVIQCVARGVSHLPVIKLEIVTLAYTIINIGIYVAWWDKPRGVNQPIRVFLKDASPPQKRDEGERHWVDRYFSFILSLAPGGGYVYEDVAFGTDTKMWKSVPTLYSGDLSPEEGNLSCATASFIGILFGGIHCLAWSSSFPSHTEQLLWRISVVAMVGIPALLTASLGVDMLYGRVKRHGPEWVKRVLWGTIAASVCIIPFAGLLYSISRVTTLALAVKNLTSLPIGAYQTVPWTQWVPHV